MKSFRIGHHDSEFLDVRIVRRSHHSRDYWDANWVEAEVEVKVGGFRGTFSAEFRTEELRDFRDELTRLYSFDTKEAKFKTLEDQLSIDIEGDSTGHFSATCVAEDKAGMGNRLRFLLYFDQTEIPEALNGLNEVVREFPVIGSPNGR